MTDGTHEQEANEAAVGPSELNDGLGVPDFEYTGEMYVSPCDRGTMLTDHPSQEGIEQILLDGYYRVEIRVWEKNKAPVKATTIDGVREILNTPNVELTGRAEPNP